MSEFDVSFESTKDLKAQLFVDFIGMPNLQESTNMLIVFTDISYNSRGTIVSLILQNKVDLTVKVSLHLEFPTTNNEVEYEEVIMELTLAANIGRKRQNEDRFLTCSLPSKRESSNQRSIAPIICGIGQRKVGEVQYV